MFKIEFNVNTKELKERINCLTKKEEIVLSLIVKGLTNKQIAKELNLSVDTIKAHIKKIYLKLNVKTRTEVILTTYLAGFWKVNE